jgi:hypothetical protein
LERKIAIGPSHTGVVSLYVEREVGRSGVRRTMKREITLYSFFGVYTHPTCQNVQISIAEEFEGLI